MADNTNRLAGTAYLSISGIAFMVVGDTSYDVAKAVRETAAGQDGIHGYIEKPKAPHIAATCRNSAGLDVAALNDMTNESVVLELANGKVITGNAMWTVGEDTEVDNNEGTFKIRFEGFQGAVSEN